MRHVGSFTVERELGPASPAEFAGADEDVRGNLERVFDGGLAAVAVDRSQERPDFLRVCYGREVVSYGRLSVQRRPSFGRA